MIPKCSKCGGVRIVEWNTALVRLDVDGCEPDGTPIYGEWNVNTDSIEAASGPDIYQCRDCDEEFAELPTAPAS